MVDKILEISVHGEFSLYAEKYGKAGPSIPSRDSYAFQIPSVLVTIPYTSGIKESSHGEIPQKNAAAPHPRHDETSFRSASKNQ